MYLSFPVYVSLQGKYEWELFVMGPWGTTGLERELGGKGGLRLVKIH